MKMKSAFLINDTRNECHHGCSRVMENLEGALGNYGVNIIGTMPVGCSLEDVPNGPDNITKSDLVIVNGEGSLHHDKPCIESIFSAAKYAIGQGKRVFLINALWQDGGIEKHRSTLESLAGIYVRDTASQLELLQRLSVMLRKKNGRKSNYWHNRFCESCYFCPVI